MVSTSHCLILHKAVVIAFIPACNNFTVTVKNRITNSLFTYQENNYIYRNEMNHLTIIKL